MILVRSKAHQAGKERICMIDRPSLHPRAKGRPHLWHFAWSWIAVALATALVLAACDIGRNEPTPTPTATPPGDAGTPIASPPSGDGSPPLSALPSIADLVDRMEPAVVSIVVVSIEAGRFGSNRVVGSGSGVIFREDGYILTNNHVIDGAQEIHVTLFDGQEMEAEIVGTDRPTDLAVIRIDQEGLSTIPLGGPSQVRIGEWVVAIGNALGLVGGPSVTMGVVSAQGRTLVTQDTTLFDLIQTDAAINRGNSGGPLINLQGEVIGINTAVLRGDDAQGIGFAVSTETAIPVADQLVRNGRVIWPWLGIGADDIDRVSAAEMDLSVREGVLVTGVVNNGPAATVGIRPKDVIVALDDQPTPNLRSLQRLLRTQFKVGQEITVTVARGDDQQEFTLTLGEFPR